MKPAVPPLAAAAPPLPEPTESSRCPFQGLRSSNCPLRLGHLEVAKAGDSERRSQQATGHTPFPRPRRGKPPAKSSRAGSVLGLGSRMD